MEPATKVQQVQSAQCGPASVAGKQTEQFGSLVYSTGWPPGVGDLESRNAELEELISRLAHDLKSPLVTIGGFVSFIQGALDRGDKADAGKCLDRIAASVAQMNRLLDDLLTVSRAGRGEITPAEVELDEVLRERLRRLQTRLSARLVEINIEPPLPRLQIDVRRVSEALDHLLSNAVKHGVLEGGGRVDVSCWRTAETVCVGVRDYGPGVPGNKTDQLFSLVSRLHAGGGNAGVGLIVAAEHMRQHGGRVWFARPADGGALFALEFPRRVLVSSGGELRIRELPRVEG